MPRAGLDAATVIGAAARLADAEGLRALTLARLASQLGVRSPSLYAHVGGGLVDLRRRVAALGAGELCEALQAAAAGRARGEGLRAVAHAYRTYAREHPGRYAALQHPDPVDEPISAAAARLVDVVLAVLRGYGLQGDDALHGARIVRSALHGFVSLEAEQGFAVDLSLDESFERLIATLDRGLEP